MTRFQVLDLRGVKTYPVADRVSKLEQRLLARSIERGATFRAFWESLPDVLAVRELREFVGHLHQARGHHPIVWMMGAHPLKVGLSPILIELVRAGYVSCLASHGAFSVHDCEIALFGKTSEDVADTLRDGRFGMARETGEFYAKAVREARRRELGLGEALGELLLQENAPFVEQSLLAQCLQANVPLTTHVGIGTDIVHEHPNFPAEALGDATYRDFLIFAETITRVGKGSAVLNVGSAVIMPEVFLKALAIARNLGHPSHGFLTANFDMIQHYRPLQNVVNRPTLTGGKGYAFTGHHEIMIPLLASALREGTSDT